MAPSPMHVIELAAFRRHEDDHAAKLRTEVPLLLGRLAAEVPNSTFQLNVRTGDDGAVTAQFAVEAGDQSAELLAEVAAVLGLIAEIEPATLRSDKVTTVWPLITSARAVLGFRPNSPATAPSVVWSTAGTRGVCAGGHGGQRL